MRSSASPSPLDQIPYQVLRRCPSIRSALLHLFNICWAGRTVPKSWKEGVIRLIPKSAAKKAPQIPENFRPIALTSCIGKLYTSILKGRWLSFLMSNGYLDTGVQKAFIPGVPGCVEHYQKLTAIIRDAHTKHRSLSLCWLDLSNAYGSVHHELIAFSLQYFHAPQCFLDSVLDIYTGLSAIITSKEWSTAPIPLKIGVYQGDPLSPLIFNTVMSTLSNSLRALSSCGYTLSGRSSTTNALLYADDVCLVADGPGGAQLLLSQVERWLQWSGMRAKISKCFALSIKASTSKRFDPALKLEGQLIPYKGKETIRFLGGPISIPTNRREQQQNLEGKLVVMLKKVDSTSVTRKQKLLLYKACICPRLSWDLATLDLPISWVSSVLEAAATRFLKKWSGLARPADTARLYLPKGEGGLALPSISLLYKRMKVSQSTLLLTSRDSVTRWIAHRSIQREKSQVRTLFKPVSFSRDVMKDDPGVRRQILTKRVKCAVSVEDAMARKKHMESLPVQGQMMRVGSYAADIWATAVSRLGSEAMKFVLNAATDTLPTNSNLAKWRNGAVSRNCKLCGHQQSLLHVLNSCEVALQLRRYNMRHDKVLSIIAELAQSYLPDSHHLTVDLSEESYSFPSHIIPTNLRPDLVIWSDVCKKLCLVELTISYESGFEDAARRKRNRYVDLVSDAKDRGYHSSVTPFQVGSRGVLDESSLESFRCILKPIPNKKWKCFLTDLTTTVIVESHRIWCQRNKEA